jgi:hypothetical protein
MSRLTKTFAVVILVLTLGLHWALLQSIAWVTMIVRYSQSTSLKLAIIQTFDGQHPCDICLFVADGMQSEKQQADQEKFTVQKFEFVIGPALAFWFKPSDDVSPESIPGTLTGRQDEPPSPPPRFP